MVTPPKSGSNMGMIIGLGCGGLALLGIIGGVIAVFAVRRSVAPPPPSYSPPPVVATTPTSTGAGAGALKAELRDLTQIKSKYGKTQRFVAEIVNTGADSIGYPAAKVTFYDSQGTAVDSGTCASIIRVLPPQDKVPCAFVLLKGEAWSSYKVELNPFAPAFQGDIADIDITDIKFTPKRGYKPDTLEGKLTNKSNFKAKNVWAIVTLYDANKKIIGSDNALVAGNDLEAGQSGLFSAKIYETAGTPESYRVVSVGYSQ